MKIQIIPANKDAAHYVDNKGQWGNVAKVKKSTFKPATILRKRAK